MFVDKNDRIIFFYRKVKKKQRERKNMKEKLRNQIKGKSNKIFDKTN